MADLFDLTGKVAIVGGGAGGIGRALALGLADYGADVAVTSRGLEKLEKVEGPVLNDVKEIGIGEGIGRYEAPRGEVFHYVRTDGTNRPIRHKVRAPSYVNIPTFQASCKGIPVADALITLASVDPCYCCTERSIKIINPEHDAFKLDLLKISREKTEQIRREIHGSK